MSISIPVQNGTIPGVVKVNPIIRYDSKDYAYEIEKSALNETVMEYTASSYTPTNVVFSIETMGDSALLSRRFLTKWHAAFTLSGTPPAGSSVLFPNGIDDVKGNVALRWLPILSSTTSLNLTVAGQSSSYSPSLYLEPLDRYSGDVIFNSQLNSICPSMHDTAQDYNQSYQTLKDPLADYFNGEFNPRGSFEFNLLSNTATDAVIEVQWNEPVIHPLLEYGNDLSGGFIGLNSSTTLNYTGIKQKRLLSIRSDSVNLPVINNISMSFLSIPTLYTRWLTPPGPAPDVRSLVTRWPFTNFVELTTQGGASILPGATATISSTLTSANAVPSKMLVFLREREEDFNWYSTDTYARIDNVNMKFSVKSGILASAPTEDLYVRACQNGLKDLSYAAWSKHVGSPLLLDFSRDIPMDDQYCIDMEGSYTLQLQIRYTNVSNRPINFTLYTIPFQTGIFSIVGTQGFLQTSIIPSNSVPDNAILKSIEGKVDFDDNTFYDGGASALSKAKKFLKSNKFKAAMRGVEDGVNFGLDVADALSPLSPIQFDHITPYIRKIIPGVKEAASVLAPLVLGSGMSMDDLHRILLDSGFSDVEIRASGITGGCMGMGLTGGSILPTPHYVSRNQRPRVTNKTKLPIRH